MVKVAIVGVTGYAGEELLKILLNHPQVEVTSLSAKIEKAQRIDQIFAQGLNANTDLICEQPNYSQIVPKCDLAFLALPHRVSMQVAPKFLQQGKRVIDLSADYRLRDLAVYAQCYGIEHQSPQYITQAVYGLPEIYRDKIKQANLIANPGCYPTAIILGCLPLLSNGLAQDQAIIADAKSGLSGAGREKNAQLCAQLKDNFMAYKVDVHQHAPEINQELSCFSQSRTEVIFTPQLLPMQRGILSTIYLPLKQELSTQEALELYREHYQNEPFVQVLAEEEFPQLKDTVNTNLCQLGLKVNAQRKVAIVVSAIDNLIKGASGQAVQNMNIMYGFKETTGLR